MTSRRARLAPSGPWRALWMVAALLFASVSAAQDAEKEFFTVTSDFGHGDLIELVGPTLPTEDFVVRFRASAHALAVELPVQSVEPGRIVVRAPINGGGGRDPALWVYAPSLTMSGGCCYWYTDPPFTDAPFRFHAPEPAWVEPSVVQAGDVIEIHGQYMGGSGSSRSLTVGGRSAQVLAWTSEVVTARLEPETASGLLGVSVGGQPVPAALLVGEPELRRKRPKGRKWRNGVLEIHRGSGSKPVKLRVRAANLDATTGVLSVEANRRTTRWEWVRLCTFPELFTGCPDGSREPDRSWRSLTMRLPLIVAGRSPPFTIRSTDVTAGDASFEYGFSEHAKEYSDPRPVPAWEVRIHAVDDKWIFGDLWATVPSVERGPNTPAFKNLEGSFRIRRR